MRYTPIILSGLILIIGANALLAIRDAYMWEKIEQRNSQIEELLSNARINGVI